MFYRFRRTLWYLLPKINIEYVYYHDLKEIVDISANIAINIFLLDLNNIHRVKEVKYYDLAFLESRIKRGDKCYVSEFNDKIVSFHWVQSSGLHFLQQAGLNIRIKKDELVVYNVRVHEEFQGNRINTAVYSKILLDAKQSNLKKVWLYTNKYNIANRTSLRKLNFQEELKIYSLLINKRFIKLFLKKNSRFEKGN